MKSLAALLDRETRKRAIWEKGIPIPGVDPDIERRDHNCDRIRFVDYDNRHSQYGWEFGHILDRALGGADHISNLRPQHWRSNAQDGGRLSGLLAVRKKPPQPNDEVLDRIFSDLETIRQTRPKLRGLLSDANVERLRRSQRKPNGPRLTDASRSLGGLFGPAP